MLNRGVCGGFASGGVGNFPGIMGDPIETAEGRIVYRHESDMGSVIQFYDLGTEQLINLLVFDAAYTQLSIFVAAAIDLADLPNYTAIPEGDVECPQFIHGSCATMDAQKYLTQMQTFGEAQINALWTKNVVDCNTARHNCDTWLRTCGSPACYRAREAVLPDGRAGDVPNLQEGIRMFCCAHTLDALDKTVADYPGYALSTSFPDLDSKYKVARPMWLSTESLAGKQLAMAEGIIYGTHSAQYSKTATAIVRPVLEL